MILRPRPLLNKVQLSISPSPVSLIKYSSCLSPMVSNRRSPLPQAPLLLSLAASVSRLIGPYPFSQSDLPASPFFFVFRDILLDVFQLLTVSRVFFFLWPVQARTPDGSLFFDATDHPMSRLSFSR